MRSPKKNSKAKPDQLAQKKGGVSNEKADLTVKRNVKDMIGTDINKRNILHRAALEQDMKLIDDILKDYGEIILSKEDEKKKTAGRTPHDLDKV